MEQTPILWLTVIPCAGQQPALSIIDHQPAASARHLTAGRGGGAKPAELSDPVCIEPERHCEHAAAAACPCQQNACIFLSYAACNR